MANKRVDHQHADTDRRVKKVKPLEQQVRELQHTMQTHERPHTH